MTPRLATALMPALRQLDPERAHALAIAGLRLGLAGRGTPPDPILATTAFGLRVASPVGLAAGFDKNAAAVGALRRLGFSFVEIGTVTPRPQAGNPRPRIFRLGEDGAIINRLGFNGAGAEAVERRLASLPRAGAPLGVNIGINKQGAEPQRDYPALVARFAPYADYIVLNVSSPNTPGLRDLQAEAALADILDRLPTPRPPILVKLAPDLAATALPGIVEGCIAAGVAGLIVSNTTIARPAGLHGAHVREAGGLSGAPLFVPATRMLAQAYLLAGGRMQLIGTGGIATGAQALDKIKAGASLVQLYTAFALAGPALLGRLHAELAAALRAEGFACIADAVGCDAPAWASR